jgi:hypothetical protein
LSCKPKLICKKKRARFYRARFCFGVIACNKRKAFVQGSEATKQSTLSLRRKMDCFAPPAMTADNFSA